MWCGTIARSSNEGLAVPISISRYTATESQLTISPPNSLCQPQRQRSLPTRRRPPPAQSAASLPSPKPPPPHPKHPMYPSPQHAEDQHSNRQHYQPPSPADAAQTVQTIREPASLPRIFIDQKIDPQFKMLPVEVLRQGRKGCPCDRCPRRFINGHVMRRTVQTRCRQRAIRKNRESNQCLAPACRAAAALRSESTAAMSA